MISNLKFIIYQHFKSISKQKLSISEMLTQKCVKIIETNHKIVETNHKITNSYDP